MPSNQKSLFKHLTAEEIGQLLPECRIDQNPQLTEVDQKLGQLLTPPTGRVTLDPKALFLGPKGENAELAEKLLLNLFRDHIFWRRNFHPEDLPAIQPEDQDRPEFKAFTEHLQRELAVLLGELKGNIPFHSPRYFGHMLADTSLPAMLGYIATMLYNPNNVCWESSPLTSLMEIEVGRSIARMLGFGRTPEELAGTWGHLTSGGTTANIEVLWVAKALKFLPATVAMAAESLEVADQILLADGRPLASLAAWDLLNLPTKQALNLKDQLVCVYAKAHPELPTTDSTQRAMTQLKAFDIMNLGDLAFYGQLRKKGEIGTPVILAAQSMHYCILKAAGLIGLGADQVWPVAVDPAFRIDMEELRQQLRLAEEQRRPVLMLLAVLGSTEEGAIDPLGPILSLRGELAAAGLSFYVHCDAAYGGYLAACFRNADGHLRPQEEMQREYQGWPSPAVYQSFAATGQADSATVDPHKLGYIPYPAGAVVYRDTRIKNLIAQEAAYALGGRAEAPGEISLGTYILEGSKPGATAAAVFLAHRVVPPDHTGYGRLLGTTCQIAKTFYTHLQTFNRSHGDDFVLAPTSAPDTNIVNFCVNVAGNRSLARMNRFSLELYRRLSIVPDEPIQMRQFFVSHTEFAYEKYNVTLIRDFLNQTLGVDENLFVSAKRHLELKQQEQMDADSELVVFRLVFMNPHILEKARGERHYIDLFFEALPALLEETRHAAGL